MGIYVKNGRIIDPANNIDCIADMLIENGVIKKIFYTKGERPDGCMEIDASGMWVVPGLIDLHVHFRDPGQTHKEDLLTGSRSATAGGFTTVCCMPNTNPVADCAEVIELIKEKSPDIINVLPIGCITKGQKGECLADIEGMTAAGICAVSDDGKSVADTLLMKKGIAEAKRCGIPVFSHCEDLSLVDGGVMNEGIYSEKFGLKGIPNDSEYVMAARDMLLTESVGTRLHICHISAKETAELLREAKERSKGSNTRVSGEACPHHFVLTDDIPELSANFKMNPPLRSSEDVAAIKQAIYDGTIDVIATDHAPHSAEEKAAGFEKAPFGIIGLETAVPLCLTYLDVTPSKLIELMSLNPAKILGLNKGTLSIGSAADITIIDPEKKYKIDSRNFYSKARNTPFDGMEVKGRVEYTIVGGRIVFPFQ